MKCWSLIVLIAGVSLSPVRGAGLEQNPVSRVATLLQNLAAKIDDELDADTKLYEDYVCWAKTVVSSKTASNEKAQSRVDSLTTYLADLDAGRIELTSERSDLEKEVNQLLSDVETAESLRNKEHADFVAATKEMDQAISALTEGIKVLDEATKDSKAASMVSLRASISQKSLESEGEGFGARAAEADALQRAVDVGSKWLKAGDALFLQRLLSGEVPVVDWKKMNRKAGFKMKYKARSVKIQDTLAKLLEDFKGNKKSAEATEKDQKETYDELKTAKEKQLKASQDSLTKGDVEGGAAGVSKSDANAEIKSLTGQIKDDTKYISETETALEKKKKEFVERKGLRVGEIAAINEAISVIHSDDARDLFKRSISFLQVSDATSTATALASAQIRDVARASGDLRLRALAARIAINSAGKFEKVIGAITKMVKLLEDEQKTDESDKGDCEKDREADTKESAELSRAVDELTDDISKLEGEIEEIKKEIEEKEANVKDIKQEVKQAKEIRADENAEWKKNDADDTAAAALVEKAAGVLKSFYKKNFSLLQKKTAARDAPEVVAGEAPPPPPATWEGDFSGAKKESNGIVSILNLIEDDIKKDKAGAKQAEDDSQAAHDKFVKESEDSIKKLNTSINDLNDSQAKKEKDISSKEATSNSKKGSLSTVIKRMKEAQPACDFLLVNFKVRSANRKLEISGLNKAKAILAKQNK